MKHQIREDGYERIANTEAFEAGIGSVAGLCVGWRALLGKHLWAHLKHHHLPNDRGLSACHKCHIQDACNCKESERHVAVPHFVHTIYTAKTVFKTLLGREGNHPQNWLKWNLPCLWQVGSEPNLILFKVNETIYSFIYSFNNIYWVVTVESAWSQRMSVCPSLTA